MRKKIQLQFKRHYLIYLFLLLVVISFELYLRFQENITEKPNPSLRFSVIPLSWGKWYPYSYSYCTRTGCIEGVTSYYILLANYRKDTLFFNIVPRDTLTCKKLEDILDKAIKYKDSLIFWSIGFSMPRTYNRFGFNIQKVSIEAILYKKNNDTLFIKGVRDFDKYDYDHIVYKRNSFF